MNLYYVLAITSGVGIAIQASTNSVLLSHLKHNNLVALILFGSGLIFLALVFLLFSSKASFNIQALKAAPSWSYIGGVFIASYLLCILFLVPKIGVANSLFFIVLGQILASLIIEHFALFGVQQKLIDMQKLIGAGLMLVGVVMAKS